MFFKQPALEVLEMKRLKTKRTFIEATYYINRLIKYFGEKKLIDVTEHEWAKYLIDQEKIRPRKYYHDKKYMRMILLYAIRHGLLEKMIQLNIPNKPVDAGKEFSEEEIQRLLSVASPTLGFQIEIAYKMGLRLREMLHLRWDQINWDKKIIVFLAKDTKTRRGKLVPINPDLYPRFRARFSYTKSPYMFPSPQNINRPQDDNKKTWQKYKTLAKVQGRWHDLRHTCASRMLRHGVSRLVVARMLGMSEQVLDRIYAHVNEEDLWRAANLMRDG